MNSSRTANKDSQTDDMVLENKEKNLFPPDRETLLKKLGETVKVIWLDQISGIKCGLIGWLFRVDVDSIKVKDLSTRGDTYNAEPLPIDQILSIQTCEWYTS